MKKLLIVVDYQNDFVTGTLGFEGAKLLEEPILNKIKEYESSNYDIIYTFDTHYDNYLETREGQGLPIKHCLEGSEGHALFGAILEHYKNSTYKFNHTIFKDTYGSSDLMTLLLQRTPYDKIELVGLVSYICVLSNAVIAKTAMPESEIIVDSKYTKGPDKNLHDAALLIMEKALNMTVL